MNGLCVYMCVCWVLAWNVTKLNIGSKGIPECSLVVGRTSESLNHMILLFSLSLFDILLSIVSEFCMWNIPCTSNICTCVTIMANQHRISLLKAFYLALTLTGNVFALYFVLVYFSWHGCIVFVCTLIMTFPTYTEALSAKRVSN